MRDTYTLGTPWQGDPEEIYEQCIKLSEETAMTGPAVYSMAMNQETMKLLQSFCEANSHTVQNTEPNAKNSFCRVWIIEANHIPTGEIIPFDKDGKPIPKKSEEKIDAPK
jgi:hypothetical protein